ncbi:MAG: prephenate dehydratase [Cyanobacteria bacterium REEB446]|nr:prephenate dehydratase [Cyanobacteria bacterium REEB446]
MKIGYLGPAGSFSHLAAINLHNHLTASSEELDFISFPTITNLVETISVSKLDSAVLPVENSLAGGVGETLDALLKHNGAYVTKEYILNIEHNLLAKNDVELSKISKLLSHPMSFAQCGDFVRVHCPAAETEPCASNSQAAILASQASDDTVAAIAPEFCAKLYNLKIIRKAINDSHNNATRFWLLKDKPAEFIPDEASKTSIIFQIIDEPGSLHKILKAFADNDINLSRIESRPSKNLLGSYLFCVDCNAHREDQNFIKAMRELSLFFNYYKWLGSYHISRSTK